MTSKKKNEKEKEKKREKIVIQKVLLFAYNKNVYLIVAFPSEQTG